MCFKKVFKEFPNGLRATSRNPLDCKTVVFFANASDGVGPSSNERSGASVKTVRENGERC